MEALTKIVDLFLEAWEYLKCWAVTMQWQNGIMMRFGRYNRYLPPGYHWKWPFFEKAEIYDTVTTTLRLPAQTVANRTVRGTLKYYIKDVHPYVCDIYAEENYLRDAAMSCIANAMESGDYSSDIILETIRKEVNQYGFKILRISMVDDLDTQNYRVILDKDLEEGLE